MAYALTCACGYVRRLLVVSLRPLSLPTRKLEAQGGAPPAKLGRRGDACGAVGDFGDFGVGVGVEGEARLLHMLVK